MSAPPSTPQARPSASSPGSSFSQALFDSLFQPGLNTPMRRAMDACFLMLFLVLIGLAIVTSGNGHVFALLGLSVGLFLAVHWFLAELDKLPPSATQIQQMPSDIPETSTAKKDR